MRGFAESLPMSLLRAREAVMRHFRASLRHHGVTEQQWRVLRALSSVGPVDVSELARMTCLLGPSLSRILRDLEGRGLIERQTGQQDQRRGLISIAKTGLALIASVAPESEAVYDEIVRRFGATRLADLQRELSELEAALNRDRVDGTQANSR